MVLMIPRSQEPERGFVLAILARGADPDEELAEVEELARTAGVEPVGRVVQHRARPAQRTYVGKGKLEELKKAFDESDAESVLVDGELDPGAAALPRGHDRLARDRPHPADPRHLRPARRQRRGQAPGRARAARVQPPAHARHVAAPRAPRRRRRHPRPRRVPARDRPPPRPPPRVRAQAPPEGAQPAARHPPQGAPAHPGSHDRARRLHERRQVDPPERAHRCGGLGREPPLRDARPDDPRLRARGPPLPRHRHGRLHPPAASSTRRGLRCHARGDARRRHHPPRRRRLGPRRRARRDGRGGRGGARRDRRLRASGTARAEQDRPRRRGRPPPSREPLSRRAAGLRGDRRGPRGA